MSASDVVVNVSVGMLPELEFYMANTETKSDLTVL